MCVDWIIGLIVLGLIYMMIFLWRTQKYFIHISIFSIMTLRHPYFFLLHFISLIYKIIDISKGSKEGNDFGPPPTKFQKQILGLSCSHFLQSDLPWHLAVLVSWVTIKRNRFPNLQTFFHIDMPRLDSWETYWRNLARK